MAIQFVIETGSGTNTAANSFATVAEADQYLENSGRKAGVWASAGTAGKQSALIQGAQYMKARWEGFWLGQEKTAIQPLSWPQRGQFYPSNHAVSANEIPVDVQNSQIEYAYSMVVALADTLAPDPTYDDSGRTITAKTEKVDVLMEQTQFSDKGGSGRNVDGFRAYPIADGLLKPFVAGGSVHELLRA